jgi:hypothetical protein
VENRLHIMKDRGWDEDKHALFRHNLGEIWSSHTSLAVSLLWWAETKGHHCRSGQRSSHINPYKH